MRFLTVGLVALILTTTANAEGGPKTEPDSMLSGENKGNSVESIDVPGYVFSVKVSSAQQLDVILDRADSLRELFNPDQHSRIAIVLHGEELRLFQKNNYSENHSVVDKARLLDRDQIIDIKACQTMMRNLGIQQSELPTFIEQVPLGPAEIDRLTRKEDFTQF